MAASSLSVAAAALPTCSQSSTSSPIDHFSVNFFFPCKPNPRKTPSKLKTLINYPTPSSFSRSSSINRSSTAFDSVVSDQDESVEEEDAEASFNGGLVSESEVEEEKQSGESGRLYVGNLPFSMTSAHLSQIFAEAGRVVSAEIVHDRVRDRSRGFAFVSMGSVEEAKEAILLFDGAQIGGRTAKVNFPEVPRGGEREVMSPKIRSNYQGFVDTPYKIYAGNLSWGLTSQALIQAFSHYPGFVSAKVIFDRDSGRSRGFGFVTFSSAQQVESALDAKKELDGRPLRLNLAEQSAPPQVQNTAENTELFSSASV